ncbi:hypothetical protein ABENE_18000 [Asticcacaulis benevestitus DSM 16100 = ATCC BAA-896]|uniref:Plasmid stabilization protein n=2 Tax=Asticcacaulis TaxID=76890 RepID=V4PF33_9CAUL|nr:hypothetical protein ABENE_18000 [Asticcacaulis benevestitus DSM 16100 = ATCC BAA-896]
MAERQINDLHREITFRSGFASRADRYIQRIVDYCLGLDTFPERGKVRDDLMPGLRTVGFERRVTIAYFVTGEVVLIEGVYYAGQNFEESF